MAKHTISANRTITLILKGSRKDKQHVRLNEFLHELDALRLALKHAETSITGEREPKVYYRIVRLTSNSPAEVTLEPVSLNGKESTEVGVDKLLDDLKYIQLKKTIPPKSNYATIEAYRGLGAMREYNLQQVIIKNGEAKIKIDGRFQRHIEKAMGPDQVEHGTISGKMEAINIHRNPRFTIYPIVGPKKVECFFDNQLRTEVVTAIDHRVEVAGEIRFKSWDKYPYAVDVREIRKLDDRELPHLIDMVGIAPNATGGLSSIDFLERIRGEAN